jgi:hypothetical protein
MIDMVNGIWVFIAAHWVEIGVALWLLEQALRILSKITPWKWDDNLVNVIENILKALFPRKQQ